MYLIERIRQALFAGNVQHDEQAPRVHNFHGPVREHLRNLHFVEIRLPHVVQIRFESEKAAGCEVCLQLLGCIRFGVEEAQRKETLFVADLAHVGVVGLKIVFHVGKAEDHRAGVALRIQFVQILRKCSKVVRANRMSCTRIRLAFRWDGGLVEQVHMEIENPRRHEIFEFLLPNTAVPFVFGRFSPHKQPFVNTHGSGRAYGSGHRVTTSSPAIEPNETMSPAQSPSTRAL